MAAHFPRGKQPEFSVHCIGTRKFSNDNRIFHLMSSYIHRYCFQCHWRDFLMRDKWSNKRHCPTLCKPKKQAESESSVTKTLSFLKLKTIFWWLDKLSRWVIKGEKCVVETSMRNWQTWMSSSEVDNFWKPKLGLHAEERGIKQARLERERDTTVPSKKTGKTTDRPEWRCRSCRWCWGWRSAVQSWRCPPPTWHMQSRITGCIQILRGKIQGLFKDFQWPFLFVCFIA